MIMHQIKPHHSKENKVTEVLTGVSAFLFSTIPHQKLPYYSQFADYFSLSNQLIYIYLSNCKAFTVR